MNKHVCIIKIYCYRSTTSKKKKTEKKTKAERGMERVMKEFINYERETKEAFEVKRGKVEKR